MTAAIAIAGVRWGRVARHTDPRGAFREVWRDSAFPELTRELTGGEAAQFVQAKISSSAAGVLRGLHYHPRQLVRWIVLADTRFSPLWGIRPSPSVCST